MVVSGDDDGGDDEDEGCVCERNFDVTAVSSGRPICSLVFERQLPPELLKQQNEHNTLSSHCYALNLGLGVEKKNFSQAFFFF